ncbi:MAG TPA: sigma-70 family RNA polymerase sigma factor [Gemmataceae bacterium]|jgi:RNA polymerase sigma factor (sigma-70 family)
MSSGQLPAVLEHLRQWAAPESGSLSDAELLARFAAGREEAAFAALMRRHGRMVWGVCRHVLRHEQDAEDAFQATFLVLARKAGSIRKGTAVASWLHGTAYHIATRARRNTAVRRARESKGESMAPAEPVCEAAWRELLAVLEEEVKRLPQKQRAAFVLCSLEGKSLAEAARQLGWKEGTVSGTLSRARDALRKRLARRGVTLSALLAGLALDRESTAPAALAERTLHTALAFAAGRPASGVVSAPVASLVRQAMRSLIVTKFRVIVVVLMAGVAAAGVAAFAYPKPIVEPERAGQHAEQPKPESGSQPRADRFGDVLPPGALARLGTVRLRSGGFRGPVVFSADGKTLFSASDNGYVHVWDAATGAPLRRFRTIAWAAGDIQLSPDRKLVAASALFDPTAIGLWETVAGKMVRRLEVPAGGKALRLTFSPDGKTLVSGGGPDNKVCFWEVSTGRLLRQLTLKTNIAVLDFSPDGKTLVTKRPGWVHLWDPATGEERRKFQVMTSNTPDYAFSPDGKVLATSRLGVPGRSHAIELWDVSSGDKRGQIVPERDAVALAFSPDGKRLASASFTRVQFWDAVTRKEIAHADWEGRYVMSLRFSPDGKTVAARGRNAEIRLWDAASGKELQPRAGHFSGIRATVFSPDGKLVATSANDSAARVWRATTGEQLYAIPADPKMGADVVALAFTPDGKTLIVADNGGVLRFHDGSDGKQWRQLSLAGDARRKEEAIQVASLAISSDGKTLTALARHWYEEALAPSKPSALTAVWNLATGERITRRDAPTSANGIWTLSPDGQLWVSQNQGPRVGVHTVATGKEILSIDGKCDGVWPAVFSPDGRLLAGVCHHGRTKEGIDDYLSSIVLWELATGAEVRRIKLKPGSPEIALAFSPNGRILASGGDGSVGLQLWDVATGERLHRYPDQGAKVRSLSFDAAGRRLVSGLADGTALVWDAADFTHRAGPPPKELTAADLNRLWTELGAADAGKGHAALYALVSGRERTVAFLRERLRSAKEDVERMRRLIADLDSEQFAVRDAAQRALEQLGSEAEPALRKALETKPSAELRKRVETLLAGPQIVRSPEVVRQVRAVQVLEAIGSKEARHHLQALADGAPAARLTREAKMSLHRLTGRTALEP